jgi:hypothetical protein
MPCQEIDQAWDDVHVRTSRSYARANTVLIDNTKLATCLRYMHSRVNGHDRRPLRPTCR